MSERFEAINVRRRRHWSLEEKLRIVTECELPGAIPAEVARRTDISTGLLYTWRRMAEGRPAHVAEPIAMLPVHVAEPPGPKKRPRRLVRLEIGLPVGIKLKVDAGVNSETLGAIYSVNDPSPSARSARSRSGARTTFS